jgi:hypothetical protein
VREWDASVFFKRLLATRALRRQERSYSVKNL